MISFFFLPRMCYDTSSYLFIYSFVLLGSVCGVVVPVEKKKFKHLGLGEVVFYRTELLSCWIFSK